MTGAMISTPTEDECFKSGGNSMPFDNHQPIANEILNYSPLSRIGLIVASPFTQ
jgi:hypothetical protein